MRSIQRLSDERLPKSLDVEEPLQARAREVAEVARALAESAARIPETGTDAPMSDADRAAFEAIARELQQHATALAHVAEASRSDEARAELAAIQAACTACHARFRPF